MNNNFLMTALITSQDWEWDFGQRWEGDPLDEVEVDGLDWFLSTGVIMRESEDFSDLKSELLWSVFLADDLLFLFDDLLYLLLDNDLRFLRDNRLLNEDDRLRLLGNNRFYDNQLLLGMSCKRKNNEEKNVNTT